MIKTTEKVEKIFEELYYVAKEERGVRSSFAKIMESNESRLNFLTYLFNMMKKNQPREYFCCLFNENIDFLSDFMNGSYNEEYKVPKKYFEDKDECLIAPEMNELEYLFKLIEANKQMYDSFVETAKNEFYKNLQKMSDSRNNYDTLLKKVSNSENLMYDFKKINQKVVNGKENLDKSKKTIQRIARILDGNSDEEDRKKVNSRIFHEIRNSLDHGNLKVNVKDINDIWGAELYIVDECEGIKAYETTVSFGS